MKCIQCGSELPSKAKFCPQCGKMAIQELKCTNGHHMQSGQKFCCECGAPIMISEATKGFTNTIRPIHPESKTTDTKPSNQPNNTSTFSIKAIVTIIILGIAVAVISAVGGVPSYIVGGLCCVILPNVWKFIDEN